MTATIIRFPLERRDGFEDTDVDDDGPGWARTAHDTLDAAERLIAQQPADVVALCQRAFDLLAAAAADIDDETTLVALARRLGDLHRYAATEAGVPADELRAWAAHARRTCPALAEHVVVGVTDEGGTRRGPLRSVSPPVAASRRRHPSTRPPRAV